MMQGIESSVVIMQQKNLSLSDKNCVLLIFFYVIFLLFGGEN